MADDFVDLADNAFRDFTIDGMPSSGRHKPIKSEVREIFVAIKTDLNALSGAMLTGVTLAYATRSAMNADLAHAAGVLAVVYSDPTVENNRIYYKVGNSGTGSWAPSPLYVDAAVAAAVAEVEPLVEEAEAAAASLVETLSVRQQFVDADQAVAGRAWRGVSYAATTFTGWGIGWGDFAAATTVRAAELVLGNLHVTDKLHVKVWRRPVADAEAAPALVPPGDGDNDELMFDTVWNTTDLVFGTPLPPIMTSVRFPFDGSIAGTGDGAMEGTKLTALPPGYIDLLTVRATLSGVAAYLACGSAPSKAGILPEYRGYFANTDGPFQEVSSPANMAYLIYGTASAPYATEGMIAPLFERSILTGSIVDRQTGTSIDLPSVRIERYSGDQIIPGQAVTVPACATEAKNEAVTLSVGGNTYLAYRFVRGVTVTRVSDSAVATLGTDVSVDLNRGIATALTGGWAVAVTIAYTGHKERYDLVTSDQSISARDETIEITLGTEDATAAAEYRPGALAGPDLPFNGIPLFSIYTTPDRSEVIHLNGGRQYLRFGRAGDLLELREKNQWRLRRLRGKLLNGDAVRFGGDGDSITMMGNRAPGVNTTPDGASRDVISYFTRYSTALRALIPQPGGHTACGWNNYIRDAWAECYPQATVTYENWAISGTDSSNGSFVEAGETYYHGTAPTRMNAAGKVGVDVWNIAFGMNEISQQDTTPANLTVLGETYRADGAELIYTTPPRQNATYNNRDLRAWKQEQVDIIRVAEALDAAYVPTFWILGPGNEGMTGLSPWTHADVSHINHPGFEELKAIGEFGAFVLGL